MANDITVKTDNIATTDGVKQRINVSVKNKQTGQTTDSLTTTDPKKAKTFYDKAKSQNPGATVNGKVDSSPFEDGTVSKPPAEKKKSYAPPPDTNNSLNEKAQAATDMNPLGPPDPNPAALLMKKAVDLSGVSKKSRDGYLRMSIKEKSRKGITGALGDKRFQAMVNRVDVAYEKVMRNVDGNAFIVLGNDRSGLAHTGYGGRGHTQCDAIDIAVGTGGYSPIQSEDDGTKVYTNPNFFVDAARIYVSQKTDVDRNFAIGNAESYRKSDAKSAVAIKADNVRIIGRESLNLVTNTDAFNSQGGQMHGKFGINLMANNNEDALQPIPLGDNLEQALLQMLKYITKLAEIMDAFVTYQNSYNIAIQSHTHHSPFFGIPVLPSKTLIPSGIKMGVQSLSKTKTSLLTCMTNNEGFEQTFLTDGGEFYINSDNNKTN